MIDLYSLATPNGHKIAIALEEMNLAYNAHTIDLRKGACQNYVYRGGGPKTITPRSNLITPSSMGGSKISPNNKIPAIVDQENGLALFESGAILQYLADKSGKFIPPKGTNEYYHCLQWVAWQIAGLGPMSGQMGFFHKNCPTDVPIGKERYLKETQRLWGVFEKHLAEGDKKYAIGDEYTIADMAIFPWLKALPLFGESVAEQFKLENYPHIKSYIERISERPAVQKGLSVTPLP